MNQCTPGSVLTLADISRERQVWLREGADALFLPPTIPGQNRPQPHTTFKRMSHSFTHSHSQTGISWQSWIKQVSRQKTDDNGNCFRQIRVLMVPNLQKWWNLEEKFLWPNRDLTRTIEMKVGRSNHFTIRTLFFWAGYWICIIHHFVCKQK